MRPEVKTVNAVIDAPDATSLRQQLSSFVAAGSTEVTPHDEKVLDEMARILPAGFPVYVANTPKTSPDDVVRVALRIQELGLSASPHVIARRVVDAQRLRNLGVPEQLIHVTGNLKFDVELPAQLLDEARALRRRFGAERPVWIAASTHAGEERQVLDAFAALKRGLPDLLLILVPRHPERFQSVARLCRQRGYAIALRSRTR